jgi:multiple sugar transport system permease protein
MTAAPDALTTSAIITGQDKREAARRHGPRGARWWTYLFLLVMALIWLLPLAWSLFTSLRPYADTAK